jgi:hypothetical protein
MAVVLLLSSCAEFQASRNSDLAIDTYAHPPAALGVAETCAKKYVAEHQEQIGRHTKYLAVQSEVIFSDEIPDLHAKLMIRPASIRVFWRISEMTMS